MLVRLPQNVDTLIFELTEVFHGEILFCRFKNVGPRQPPAPG